RGALTLAVKSIPLIRGGDGSQYSFSLWEKRTEAPMDTSSWDTVKQQRYQSFVDRGLIERKIVEDEWNKAVAAAKLEHCEGRLSLLDECCEELKGLDKVMDEKFGRESPGVKGLEGSLVSVRSLMARIVKEKRPADIGDGDGLQEG